MTVGDGIDQYPEDLAEPRGPLLASACRRATARDDLAACEDHVAAASVGGRAAAVVCDGVGGLPNSEIFSRAASAKACELLVNGTSQIDRVLTDVEHFLSRDLEGETDGATTLLGAVIDSSGGLEICAAGNGAVLEVSAHDAGVGSYRLMYTNLFLPHVDYSAGRETLTSVLDGSGARLSQRVLRSTGDRTLPTAVLLCTDGIHSREDSFAGRAADGSAWEPVGPALDALLGALRDAWGDLVECPEDGLPSYLELAVEAMITAAEPHLDDDAGLGVIFTRPA